MPECSPFCMFPAKAFGTVSWRRTPVPRRLHLAVSQPAVDDPVREAILKAASELFYQRGIHAVGMDELRDRAGVTLKRIYAAFPSKADLVEAYLTWRDAKWRGGPSAGLSRPPAEPRDGRGRHDVDERADRDAAERGGPRH